MMMMMMMMIMITKNDDDDDDHDDLKWELWRLKQRKGSYEQQLDMS